MTQLVIFDLDGTLIDSIGDLAAAMNSVLRGNGYPTHPVSSYQVFVGDGIEKLVRRALAPGVIDESKIEGFVDQMRQEYSTMWLDTTRPFPMIPELLTALHSSGIRTAVLSNKPDGPTRFLVDELFPDHPFAIVRGERSGVPRKPDPTSTLEIISELEAAPQHTVFVGDTPIDVTTGVRAGTRTVGVTWGFREANELRDAGADHVIDKPLDLAGLIDGVTFPMVSP
jgi:phosphoglycolate phosphatase